MEPTRTASALADLNKLLRSPDHRARRNAYPIVRGLRDVAIEVAIICALGIVVAACIPLVIWLWMVVL